VSGIGPGRDDTSLAGGEPAVDLIHERVVSGDKRYAVTADQAADSAGLQSDSDLVLLGVSDAGKRLLRPGGALDLVGVAALVPVPGDLDAIGSPSKRSSPAYNRARLAPAVRVVEGVKICRDSAFQGGSAGSNPVGDTVDDGL
jgi:hypothetical protein